VFDHVTVRVSDRGESERFYAAVLAAQILSVADPSLVKKLDELKERLARGEKL